MTYTDIGEPINYSSVSVVTIKRHLEKGDVESHLLNCQSSYPIAILTRQTYSDNGTSVDEGPA